MPLPGALILLTAILILDVGHKQLNNDILIGCLYLSEGYNTLNAFHYLDRH
jgi:hypothetical protein